MIETLIVTFLDPWVIFGFAAQGLFFARFIVQWIASERAQQTVVPVSFWYLSIIGALMILVYAIKQEDVVFIFGQALALLIYARNLHIYFKRQRIVREETTTT